MSTLNCGTLVDGWLVDKSTLRPISTARIAYVDTNGTGGSLVNPADVANPWEPTTAEVPLSARYSTLTAGYSAIRSGEADWLLLASGQTFDQGTTQIWFDKVGASATNRLIISSFGPTSSPMPIVTRTRVGLIDRRLFRWTPFGTLHASVAHLHFQSKELESTGNIDDILVFELQNLAMAGSNIDMDLVVEGCHFEGAEIILQGDQASATNKETGPFWNGYVQRRCVTWNTHSSAILFTSSDEHTVEENAYIDIGLRRLQYLEDQGSTTFQVPQCCYVAENATTQVAGDGSLFRNNTFIELASSAIQQRPAGTQEFNAFFRVPSWGLCGNNVTSERNGVGRVVGNVGVEGTDIDSTTITDASRGWGTDVGNCVTLTMSDNIIASNLGDNPLLFNVAGGQVGDGTGTYTMERNIAWNVARPLLLGGGVEYSLTIKDNTFYVDADTNSEGAGNMIRINSDAADYWDTHSWLNNTYHADAAQSTWFSEQFAENFATSFSEFVTASGETGSIDATDPWVGSGTPNIATYIADNPSVTTKTLDGFKAAIKAQRYGNWDPRLTALHAVNFYRAGFDLDAVEFAGQTEGANAAPSWTTIPRQSVSEGSTATIDLSGYVSDADADTITLSEVGTWPTWASLSGTVVTLTPEVGDASGTNYTFDVRATDDGDPIRTADATITVTVTEEAGGDPPSGEANPSVLYSGVISFVIFGGKG